MRSVKYGAALPFFRLRYMHKGLEWKREFFLPPACPDFSAVFTGCIRPCVEFFYSDQPAARQNCVPVREAKLALHAHLKSNKMVT